MGVDLSRFRETFFQEAAEHLDAMERGLLSLESGSGGLELLNEIFRGAHSMKAGAAMFGFEAIARFTHVLETLLDRMRNGEVTVTGPVTEGLLRSVDWLREALAAAERGEAAATAEMESLIARLGGDAASAKSAAPETEPRPGDRPKSVEYAVRFEPAPEFFRIGLDPLLVLRDLSQLGRVVSVEPDLSRLPALDSLNPGLCYLGWSVRLASSAAPEQVRDVFAFVEDVAAVTIEAVAENARKPAAAAAASVARRDASIRVATEKVDRLIDLVGELVIAQSVAMQIVSRFTPDRLTQLQEAVAEMDRYTHDLQDRAMRIRMLPLASVFSRFPRLVHDTAQALGKKVALTISGEETELDKAVVERISDPLTHLIRNAVDHGVEPPEERRRAGKPEEGNLRLNAFHQAGNVIIEVSDDGRGLDAARIRAKAVERGLIGGDEEITDEQAYALIFRPGFSTAEKVTDLSGRGVGMDVVKRGVEALNGGVAVESASNRGALFRIKLPLTLAILDGLLLKVGEQTYVLPLASIVESAQPRREQLRGLPGGGELVTVRKEQLPLLRLHRLFGIPTEVTDPARGLVVVVEHEAKQMALLVDEIAGQQQVVVKSLEANFRRVEGITGATILGDGRAALILDVAGIVNLSHAQAAA